MARRRWAVRPLWLVTTFAAVTALVAAACGGGAAAPAAPAPQPQPAAKPAQPAPAAPAAEPQALAAPAQKPAPAFPGLPTKSAAPTAEKPKYGGILLHGNRGDPPAAFDTMRSLTINLHQSAGGLNGNGNLVKPCRENVYEVCGGVAEKWEANSDFTQWTFKVRDTIKWHDGKPFTAEDAKFWVDLAFFGAKSADGAKTRRPAYFKATFGDLKKTEVLDGNRLRLTLGTPEAQYPFGLAISHYTINHPPHLMKPHIDKGNVEVAPLEVGAVSIGPFKLLKYEKGSRVQVRRNELYWEKDKEGRQLPYLDGIDFAIFTDPSAVDAAFRVGRLDAGTRGFGFTLNPERKVGIDRDMGDKVWYYETPATRGGAGLNTLKPGPLQDVRVRKAISLWMDKREAIPAVLGFGYLFTILGPKNPFSSPDFLTWPGYNEKTREQDRAEAKRLMAAAGYSSGFQINAHCRRLWISRCEFVNAQLRGLGIDLKLDLKDDAGWEAARLSLDYELNPSGGSSYPLIPEATLSDLNRYSISKPAEGKHDDPKITEFFERLRSAATSYEQRIKIWREMERYIILEQVYLVPMFGDTSIIPFRTYVRGVVVPGEDNQNNTDNATVWLDK